MLLFVEFNSAGQGRLKPYRMSGLGDLEVPLHGSLVLKYSHTIFVPEAVSKMANLKQTFVMLGVIPSITLRAS